MGLCIHCGHSTIRECPQYGQFHRITSDCRPWAAGGQLGICTHCATVQKPISETWIDECRRIYSDYNAYHQGNGAEQAVFQTDGFGLSRSRALLTWVFDTIPPVHDGQLLDFGCGGGHLLATMSELFPDWRLAGADLGDLHRAKIEGIPRVEHFHSGRLDQLPDSYHLITAVHLVEHLDHPSGTLKTLASHLHPGGRMVIEVPNLQANPFDLLIADHVSHFTVASLHRLLLASNLQGFLRENVIPRELSAIVQPRPESLPALAADDKPPAPDDLGTIQALVDRHLAWLKALLSLARQLAEETPPLALMGSSIAAGWLAGELGDKVACFVDEDPNRIGCSFLGRPILSPGELHSQATLLLPMVPSTASAVAERFTGIGIPCRVPPPW
jgi:2-polyprenyl-3-methyl-5-hydroxy-6-metoxy-1,4-benzoquinol methylase